MYTYTNTHSVCINTYTTAHSCTSAPVSASSCFPRLLPSFCCIFRWGTRAPQADVSRCWIPAIFPPWIWWIRWAACDHDRWVWCVVTLLVCACLEMIHGMCALKNFKKLQAHVGHDWVCMILPCCDCVSIGWPSGMNVATQLVQSRMVFVFTRMGFSDRVDRSTTAETVPVKVGHRKHAHLGCCMPLRNVVRKEMRAHGSIALSEGLFWPFCCYAQFILKRLARVRHLHVEGQGAGTGHMKVLAQLASWRQNMGACSCRQAQVHHGTYEKKP